VRKISHTITSYVFYARKKTSKIVKIQDLQVFSHVNWSVFTHISEKTWSFQNWWPFTSQHDICWKTWNFISTNVGTSNLPENWLLKPWLETEIIFTYVSSYFNTHLYLDKGSLSLQVLTCSDAIFNIMWYYVSIQLILDLLCSYKIIIIIIIIINHCYTGYLQIYTWKKSCS
jgi:hypothetical protein